MKRAWLIVLALSAGCASKSRPDASKEALAGAARCRQVVDHLNDLDRQKTGSSHDDEYQKAMSDNLVAMCSNTWTNAAVDCVLALKKDDSQETCEPLIPRKQKSPVEKTERLAKRIAFEAYPMWSVEHPDKACPDNLTDLVPFIEVRTTTDAWGHGLTMYCGANLPAGVVGVGIASPGPDGKLGTADDINSW